jgi:uncharacterized membrane-anchored protein
MFPNACAVRDSLLAFHLEIASILRGVCKACIAVSEPVETGGLGLACERASFITLIIIVADDFPNLQDKGQGL